MEPVSISIGAVALISLLTTCVECFEYIDAATTCGRDLELLTTKFAIEKARLLIWGDSVGISSTNTIGNNKVESPYVRPIVEQILNCIRMLFEDTNALTAHYGLEPTHDDALAINRPSASAGSPGLRLRLKVSYIQFKSRVERRHNQTSTTKKTKWAIRDKHKFSSLVEEIHQFIDGLEAVTSSVEMVTKRAALVREELSTVEDPEDLRLIAEASVGSNQQWSDAASVALGASVCGTSDCKRIRDWMITASDARMSTVVDCAGSQPSLDLPEASTTRFSIDLRPYPTGRPSPAYLNPIDWGKAGPGHYGLPPLLNHGDSKMLELLTTWTQALPAVSISNFWSTSLPPPPF
ncbi:MAG: hypothetical protein L6R35_005954 [Caloplaca aegaea]|nr:MAG: hypothetical protein L6R35_005954 [Caloplaca aegaea]